ncbi:MAG: hypothetical protein HY329_15875 [Chloroflexi bacterium]|nr:hypothetical protein [Chloroflexota bacterium]
MTPTLLGRWQTRFLLLTTVGLGLTLPFALALGPTPLINVGLVLLLGFGWDVLYDFLQKFRWDRDWPPAFQLLAGAAEGMLVYLIGLALAFESSALLFLIHYGLVWLATFVTSQGPMRILFPRWRYRGGQWL